MVLHRYLLLPALFLCSCANLPAGDERLALSGDDDAAAAVALEGFLGEIGLPVETGSDGLSVFVYRRGMATLLTPVTRSEGLDRLIATRSYAPAAGRDDSQLVALATRLNSRLNVGVFSVESGALVFQTHMTFVDQITAAEISAFLDWLDAAELAIVAVDRDDPVLLLSDA